MASPVGEASWVNYVDEHLRDATDLDGRVRLVEHFRGAVSAEPGSLKVWIAYCEYFWSLYVDCQPGSDAGWPPEEQELGCEAFTLDAALNLWQEGYEAVQYRLSDSHELWNRWIALEMELLARTRTEQGVRRITQLFKNRLVVPHTTWDNTSQMFSSFLSEYNRQAYESEMQQATKNAKDAKRIYGMRDGWEMKLSLAAKSDNPEVAQRHVMTEYLSWEIKGTKQKKDGFINFQICLGLFARALTGMFALDEDTWMNYLVLISSTRSDIRAGRCKTPEVAQLLPSMLDAHRRAVHHIPWSGTIWARYILSAEEAGLGFTDMERIKHAATSSAQLDRDGMTAVLDMYSAWCCYLKRQAMNPTATEEAVDVAEVGLQAALEDVRHWGKRRYGDAYQGDPNYRLEKILIQFLTEKKEDIEAARALWDGLSTSEIYGNSYDFWLSWYLWEMVVFASSKSKARSPTPATLAQGLRVPTHATRVFGKALKIRTLDWPERVMDVYLQHCSDYELPDTLREAQDTIYKTRKGVAKRREREAAQAAQTAADAQMAAATAMATAAMSTTSAVSVQAQVPEPQDVSMGDISAERAEEQGDLDDNSGSKRKRDPAPEDDGANKRAKNDPTATNGSNLKRDRENTSLFVSDLPDGVTQTKIKHFFREFGHINHVDLQKEEGAPPVALVEFRSAEDAQTALMRDGKKIDDAIVRVSPATDCTLFITNYPPDADEDYIRKLFKKCGQIHSIRFPSLKYNVKRRFCYVSFRDHTAAAVAIKLDGRLLEGGKYKLQVKMSDPGAKQNRQGAQAEQRELHVTNLHRDVKDKDVEDMFAKAGTVSSVRIIRDRTGFSTGTAFVVMGTKEQAQETMTKLDKLAYRGHILTVELSKPKAIPQRSDDGPSPAGGFGDASSATSPASQMGERHDERQQKQTGEEGDEALPGAPRPAGKGEGDTKTKLSTAASVLMPPPSMVRRPVLGAEGRGRPRFVVSKKAKVSTPASTPVPLGVNGTSKKINGTSVGGSDDGGDKGGAVGGKSNADFKKMFLGQSANAEK